MTIASDTPKTGAGWTKTVDDAPVNIWRNGQGEIVSITQTHNHSSDYWEVTDTTGQVTDGRTRGPFESYESALTHVNKFIPSIGREELPDEVAKIPDDEVVEVGSYPGQATEQTCSECGEELFAPYRVEYGDGSAEWLCPPDAAARFDWSFEKSSTVEFDINDSGVASQNSIEAAETLLSEHADALIGAGVIDVNGMATTLDMLHQYKYDSQRDKENQETSAPGLHHAILNHIIEYRNEHDNASWRDIRDTLQELQQFAHEYAREEAGKSMGRREVLQEIQESEMTPNEWFADQFEDTEGT